MTLYFASASFGYGFQAAEKIVAVRVRQHLVCHRQALPRG
jgi:hypothetical protein